MTALALTTALSSAAHAGRGTDGELKILSWQAISTMNPYLSGGTKEQYASSAVIEPLARYDEGANIVPILAESIPTTENGGVSADLTTITWKLKAGTKWSDGSDFTADDVVFTWQYCTAPGGGCASAAVFNGIKEVVAVDPLTVKVTFGVPKPFPYTAFVGSMSPIIQKAQFQSDRNGTVPGDIFQGERRRQSGSQPELSRRGQARVRYGDHQGRRRPDLGCERRPGNRRV
jgi:peptide/nickel transport system substrate-binding protein